MAAQAVADGLARLSRAQQLEVLRELPEEALEAVLRALSRLKVRAAVARHEQRAARG